MASGQALHEIRDGTEASVEQPAVGAEGEAIRHARNLIADESGAASLILGAIDLFFDARGQEM